MKLVFILYFFLFFKILFFVNFKINFNCVIRDFEILYNIYFFGKIDYVICLNSELFFVKVFFN